eukprot:SAG11_NODE_10027_length_862_cov_0.699869_1_plen_47_part_10
MLATAPVISVWQSKDVAAKQQERSHSAPVTCVVYNSHMRQVISADEA